MKKINFCILKVTEDFGTDPNLHMDPLVRGTDPEHRCPVWIGWTDLQGVRAEKVLAPGGLPLHPPQLPLHLPPLPRWPGRR
jgi:hypothetical protein